MIRNRHILITGGAGSIGSELTRQLVDKNKVYILDNNETAFFDLFEELKINGKSIYGRVGDVRNIETLREIKQTFIPDLIFIAHAYKHVTPMEWFPEEAVNVNIIGLLNILKVTKEWRIKDIVFISTDKVVNYNSVMGVSKRLCELIIRNAGFITVRFSNVLGSRGSIIPIWQRQIDQNKPLTITDEKMMRYFMTIEDACELVIKAAEEGKGGEIYILDMGKQVNILEVAKKILKEIEKPDYPIKMIGIRPGEVLKEELMTEEEKKVAVKRGKFWVIKL